MLAVRSGLRLRALRNELSVFSERAREVACGNLPRPMPVEENHATDAAGFVQPLRI